ncbi:MAG: hypothetical protein ACLPND_04405 [Candidatus Korobacteraceae bacterium]
MYCLFVRGNDKSGCFGRHALIGLWAFLLCSCVGALAQSAPAPLNAPFSIQATHILGLPNIKNNCQGMLSIQNDTLRFQKDGDPDAEVNTASVRALFLGEESKQVGGVPMKLGKAAAPYGGGRVVSLFAHKKYDTLTLEYVDSNGGVHGAIFQLKKGQGELVKKELVARGVSSSPGEDQSTKQSTSEVTYENK